MPRRCCDFRLSTFFPSTEFEFHLMAAKLKFSDLSPQALSSILVEFCDGKTISTMLNVFLGDSRNLRPMAYDVCRGVLVERFVRLKSKLRGEPEAQDVVDATREDVRLSHSHPPHVGDFSRWCATLEYFEVHVRTKEACSLSRIQWVVWFGQLSLSK